MDSTRRQYLKCLPVSMCSALACARAPRVWSQNARRSAVRPVIIDADTANEVDDLFAIVRSLIEPSFHVVG